MCIKYFLLFTVKNAHFCVLELSYVYTTPTLKKKPTACHNKCMQAISVIQFLKISEKYKTKCH